MQGQSGHSGDRSIVAERAPQDRRHDYPPEILMTRDLSVLIGADRPWMNTQAFLAKLDENLQKAMK